MIWYVALGGAAGSAARYAVWNLVERMAGTAFPVGTLVVNVAGGFLVGVAMRYLSGVVTIAPEARALVTAGILGGFTTFSSFSYETVALAERGAWKQAATYVALSVALSLVATVAGLWVTGGLMDLRGKA